MLALDDWLDGANGASEDALKDLRSGGSTMDGMGGMGDMGGGNGGAPAETPQDIAYPLYLVNGKPADDPEELEVREGEKVRIRLINPSGATIYRVALAGHRMTVTHADGQPVEPVEVDVVRIGMGERYDVIVAADNPGTWQLAARIEGADDVARAIVRYEGTPRMRPPPTGARPSSRASSCSTRCSGPRPGRASPRR
ncbi:multicopper oxidase domain-containing protein [Rubrobacter marinus]|uniref:multicopper oxidase domain-containing protein n=1 Tax=Rubrobacter marinus TaxID=2653852 RepID=UPI00140C2D4F|nr:multicopper oxidase domain-containing protein [Rubrobacter marinus]